jgi:RNA polymerase sigma factor (sigma-70 family)
MKQQELIPHLFRTEYRKITAVLCKLLGIAYLEVAEDITSDTFLLALETWSYKGLPPNPTAWLYAVAKNKAKDYLTRHALFTEKVVGQVQKAGASSEVFEVDLSEKNITDSQLQMLFALCHPAIAAEAQIGLSLRILCGFGIDEIADAFLTNKETINKRLSRAREKLRLEKVLITLPEPSEIDMRLETVLTTLYLLFNEGYYSERHETVLRDDLCLEAMRLTYLLLENEQTNRPPVNALMALMCFHASRFEARRQTGSGIILYDDQDQTLWNQELLTKGMVFLDKASQGKVISTYHVEATIAYWHTIKEDKPEKWESILQLYNHLLLIRYSPVAALNRAFALAKVKGNAIAIRETEKLDLPANPFYYALLGTLYDGIDGKKARLNFEQALSFAKTKADKQAIQRKIDVL